MKKIYKFLCALVSMSLLFCFTVNAVDSKTEYSAEESEDNTKIYSDVSIDDNFEEDSVIVIIDQQYGGINKVHEKDYFCLTNIEEIVDLTQIDNYEDNNSLSNKPMISSTNFRQILKLKLNTSGKQGVIDAIRELEQIDGIVYAGPNYIVNLKYDSFVPNDTLYDEQWNLTKIQAPNAWDITVGTNSVRVGVIDSGIASHSDLNDNVIGGKDFVNNNTITTDDTYGHGTRVSGIIGAVGNNTYGISGVAHNVSIVPLQVYNGTSVDQLISAITYAIEKDIPIINYSMSFEDDDEDVYNGLNQAIANYQGLFVCAAGNDGENIDDSNKLNSKYRYFSFPNVIVVAGTDKDDKLFSAYDANNKLHKSNFGVSTVHLAAPGISVQTTSNTGGFVEANGTSMAAPHVAGVAALILSLRPNLTAAEVKALILDNVDKVDALSAKCITGGRLNAYKAVRAATEAETFVADANNDGKSDVILSRNNNGKRQFKVFLGEADGSYYLPETTNSTYDFSYSDPAYIGDFNGDNYTDILIHWANGENKRQLLVFTGKGDGTFNEGVNLSSTRNHLPNLYPSQFFVGDVNGDNKDDFIVHFRNDDGKRCALVYKGKSTAPYLSDAPTNALTSTNDYRPEDPVFVGDFNGDGRTDMLVHWARDNDFQKDKRAFVIYTGKSDGTFNTGANFTSSRYHKPETYPTKFFVTDVNGDGKDDFVVHFRNDDGKRCNLVYKGKSASPYVTDASTNAITSTNNYEETTPVFVGDVNGDGYSDMVVHWVNNGIRQLMTYTAKADGTYNTAVKINTGDTHLGGRFFLADVNGDGRDDFIVKYVNETSGYMKIRVYFGTTSGGFASGIDSVTGLTPFYDE